MKQCRHIQKQFIEACYHELDQPSQETFDSHLSACDSCKRAFQETQSTLKSVSDHRVPDHDDAYWDEYWNQLAGKLNRKTPKKQSVKLKQFHPSPTARWTLGVAFALVLGIFIGRIDRQQPIGLPVQVATQNSDSQLVSVQNQAAQYLEMSKLILLGITNTDSDPSNFSLQQSKSAELVSQTPALQKSLTSANQYLLSDLISELELILMQIANLENEHDIEGIELIKAGSKQQALLFKINIGEMHLSGSQNKTQSQAIQQPVI